MKKLNTLMIRLDNDLLNQFKLIVENDRTTMSHEIRQFIIKYVENRK